MDTTVLLHLDCVSVCACVCSLCVGVRVCGCCAVRGGAAFHGMVAPVRSWVASGADINVLNVFRSTPLMLAAWNHHTPCVAELLRLGADARRSDLTGRTALHWLAAGRHFVARGDAEDAEVVRLLVAGGCGAEVRGKGGLTAVEVATRCGQQWGHLVGKWVAATTA